MFEQALYGSWSSIKAHTSPCVFHQAVDVVKAKVDEAQWAESVVAEEWPKHTWHHQKPGFTFRGVC